MDDFAAELIETGETTIFVRSRGSGPPVLLLHGFPQTHLMWRDVAPRLGPVALWRAWSDDVRGRALRAGHFFPEEAPERTAEALGSFFGGG